MIHEVGSWQHFVKRQDNLGLPIMEVKQKYLKEMNSSPIDLTGGGRRTTSSPTVYTYGLGQCCGSLCSATAYSTSPLIIVGTIFYSNPQLTIPFVPPCNPMLDGCISDGQTSPNGIFIDGGVVTSITEVVSCFD